MVYAVEWGVCSSYHGAFRRNVTLPSYSSGLSRAVSAELVVARLQQQLREKDLKLTDIQLEALTSAHQLDHLRDAVNRMQVRACGWSLSIVPEYVFTLFF